MKKDIRVRFAPSPTGLLHLGGVRTALYNYLLARQKSGTFILRIEDTDQTRYVEGSVENLINSLKELGISHDDGPYYQSQRLDLYHKLAQELIEKDKAYYCFCSKETLDEMRKKQEANKETTKYDGRCRHLTKEEIEKKLAEKTPYVIRMKIEQTSEARPQTSEDHLLPPLEEGKSGRVFSFNDLIRGNVQISADLVEDQVIIKTDGFPTYHLAAVVDDHYMQISHVLRGEEWLYSTPKHIFLYEALGWEAPIWVHLPLLLNTDRSKLSKRHGDFSVSNYLGMGYLKEAIINFVALLGWHSAEDRELYTLDELIREFSLERITKSGAIFDITKLDWMNGWYIRNLPLEYIADLCRPYFAKANIDISDNEKYLKVIKRARDQITKLPEIIDHATMFYKESTVSDENMEIIKSETSQKVLKWIVGKFGMRNSECGMEISESDIGTIIKACSEELGIKGKNLYFPLRIALYGDCHGPDIPLLIDIYGLDVSIAKLKSHILL